MNAIANAKLTEIVEVQLQDALDHARECREADQADDAEAWAAFARRLENVLEEVKGS